MKALIEVATGKVLCAATEDLPIFSGAWGAGLQDGTLQLVPLSQEAPLEELIVVGGVAVVDPAVTAEKNQHNILRAKIKAIKKADLSDLDKCADAIVDICKVLKKLI